MTNPEVRSYHLGLTGYPLGHSLSPAIHASALQACGLRGCYTAFPISPQDEKGLRDLISGMRHGNLDGLNVTIPHKHTIIPFLDKLTPVAQAIGAVNTIYCRKGIVIGDNTDAPAFLSDLKRFLGKRHLGLGKSALVIGAGGSARAVVYALNNDGWDVTITSRRIEHAGDLASLLGADSVKVMDLEQFNPEGFQLVVNTTPLGMSPHIDQSPWPEKTGFPAGAVIYDLVYNPHDTKLVKDAQAHGLHAITGLGMLVEQAILSFEIWTGCRPPRDVLLNAASRSLKTEFRQPTAGD